VVSLIYADSGAYKLVRRNGKGKNFVGYIAVEDVPVGEKADVAIVWRGTITQDEWLQVNTRAQHMHACSTCSMSGTQLMLHQNRSKAGMEPYRAALNRAALNPYMAQMRL
jgi:hypothetical protein